MSLTYLAYAFSLALMYFSVVLLLPIFVALFYRETDAIFPFIIAAATSFFVGGTLKKIILGANSIKSINDYKLTTILRKSDRVN